MWVPSIGDLCEWKGGCRQGVQSGKCFSCEFWIVMKPRWEGRCVSDIYPAEFWDAPKLFWSVDYLDLSLQCNHQSSHRVHNCEMRLVAIDKFIIFGNFHYPHIMKRPHKNLHKILSENC